MRITASQLRRIIREELNRGIREADETAQGAVAMPTGDRRPRGTASDRGNMEEDPEFLKFLNRVSPVIVAGVVGRFCDSLEGRPGGLRVFPDIDTSRIGETGYGSYMRELLQDEGNYTGIKMIRTPRGDTAGDWLFDFPKGEWLNGVANIAADVISASAKVGMRADIDVSVQPPATIAKSIRSKAPGKIKMRYPEAVESELVAAVQPA